MKFTTSMRHAEYVLSDAPGLTVTDLWPSTDMDELLSSDDLLTDEQLAERYKAEVGEDPHPDWDLLWEHIVRIEGTPEAVSAGLQGLIGDLSNTPGGDDDTYDYWPSGVIFALSVAEQLGGDWRDKIIQAVHQAIAHKEAADELYDKIGIEPPNEEEA